MAKNRFPVDAAITLRAESAAALTATASLPSQPLLSPGNAAYWNKVVRDGKLAVVIFLTEVSGTSPTFDAVVKTTDKDGANAQTHFTQPLVAGQNVIQIDQNQLLAADADAANWLIGITIGGTTPSGKVFAYVVPPGGIGA